MIFFALKAEMHLNRYYDYAYLLGTSVLAYSWVKAIEKSKYYTKFVHCLTPELCMARMLRHTK